MKTLSRLLLPILTSATFAQAEIIELTDTQGRSFKASLISANEKSVDVVRSSDRRRFTLALSDLSDETSTAIDNWIKEGGHLSQIYEVSLNTGKTARTTGREDFDDKRVNLEPVVTIGNPSPSQETKALQITVWFFGRPVDSTSNIYVFSRETLDIPQIAPQSSRSLELKRISKSYDNRGYAQHGSRYLGYAWIIHNKDESEIINANSVPSSLTSKYGSQILQLKADSTYTKDLVAIGGAALPTDQAN